MNQYVIIGNAIAATGCIEGIRSIDKEGSITVISKEPYPAYCRPLISYYLQGKTDLEKINYRSKTFYTDNNCRVLYDCEAVKVDEKSKTVITSKGDRLPYTSLCAATGSSPFIPPFDGMDTVPRRFSFMNLDDTLALEKAIDKNSRVLIIGAGLIGLKCAEGLFGKVAEITVCDLADRVLSSILDQDTAPLVQKHLENVGIKFLMSDSVKKFNKTQAVMNSGKTVDFDILVTAVGVRANTSVLKDAGVKAGRGISVNSKMETSIKDIYSAGDCTEGFDISSGSDRVLALLPNAYMQGHAAGVNMAGGEESFHNAIPMNSIGFFGLHIMTAGSYITEENGGRVYNISQGSSVKKFFTCGNRLKGYILIGCVERGGIYTSLIREQTPLDSIDFELLTKSATFMAFSPKNRSEKFGGVI